MSKEARTSLAGTTIALALGLMASHVMVPPTPGPIAAAGILKADLGLVIIWGFFISILSLIPAVLFAKYYAGKTFTEIQLPQVETPAQKDQILEAPIFLALLPIVTPILLIVLKSFHSYTPISDLQLIDTIINFIGTPLIALLIGLGFALLLPKPLKKQHLSTDGWVGQALQDAAIILLITGAGGAFGKVLQNSGLDTAIGDSLGGINLGIWLPFIIAAALKSAQGSSTVAIITTASILSPLLAQLGFDNEMGKVVLVLAIGAGSAVVSHANDSYFWIVTQMSGMDVKTGYRLHSLGTAVLGVSAAMILQIIWWIFG